MANIKKKARMFLIVAIEIMPQELRIISKIGKPIEKNIIAMAHKKFDHNIGTFFCIEKVLKYTIRKFNIVIYKKG